MSGDLDPRLAAFRAEPFSDRPRFYPPGEHPATAEQRRLLAFIARIDPDGVASAELADYLRAQIAAFEEVEAEAKQAVLRQLDRRD